MYMKCGNLNEGSLVCEKLDVKNLISRNPMIAGCGMHSLGKDAGNYFYGMVETGFKPDKVCFVAVLSASSHAGVVFEDRKIYDQTTEEYAIEPQMEGYACVVDLSNRSGSLQEAREIAKLMPLTPNACVLGALLNACRMCKLPVLWRQQPHIFSQNSETMASYMLLSITHAANGRWDDPARVRISAEEKGLKKVPGQSWIELNKKVSVFCLGASCSWVWRMFMAFLKN